MIAIVDYGGGNLGSVARALEYLGHRCEVTNRAEILAEAERVILPGVGAAGAAMENLGALGLLEPLRRDVIAAGKPFLGICIGIQLLLEESEENDTRCLGVIPGRVVRFPRVCDGRPLKVPQIGWNRVHFIREHELFAGIADSTHFYFVNSFYPMPSDPSVVLATAGYGVTFVAALGLGNVIATQFHLEKSGAPGLKMLDNFCRMNG
jgi:imidazole glycerol-phosphate synthase subunit HisH